MAAPAPFSSLPRSALKSVSAYKFEALLAKCLEGLEDETELKKYTKSRASRNKGVSFAQDDRVRLYQRCRAPDGTTYDSTAPAKPSPSDPANSAIYDRRREALERAFLQVFDDLDDEIPTEIDDDISATLDGEDNTYNAADPYAGEPEDEEEDHSEANRAFISDLNDLIDDTCDHNDLDSLLVRPTTPFIGKTDAADDSSDFPVIPDYLRASYFSDASSGEESEVSLPTEESDRSLKTPTPVSEVEDVKRGWTSRTAGGEDDEEVQRVSASFNFLSPTNKSNCKYIMNFLCLSVFSL